MKRRAIRALVAITGTVVVLLTAGWSTKNYEATYVQIAKAHFRENAPRYEEIVGSPLTVTNEQVYFGSSDLMQTDKLVAEVGRDVGSIHFRDDAIYVKCEIVGLKATRVCYVVLRVEGKEGKLGVMNTLISDPEDSSSWQVSYFKGEWLGLTKSMLDHFRTKGPYEPEVLKKWASGE